MELGRKSNLLLEQAESPALLLELELAALMWAGSPALLLELLEGEHLKMSGFWTPASALRVTRREGAHLLLLKASKHLLLALRLS